MIDLIVPENEITQGFLKSHRTLQNQKMFFFNASYMNLHTRFRLRCIIYLLINAFKKYMYIKFRVILE